MERSAEYQAPAVETFEETEILGDAPQATGTEVHGSQIVVNGA